ncbi:MAG: cytochrome c [Nitrospinota bacterium]|nr:MAG: cytochrome c [Nitrospinota bacterium]
MFSQQKRVLPILLSVLFGTVSLFSVATAASVQQLYTNLCATCHGVEGKGNGPAGVTLNPKPADFTDCAVMQDLSDTALATTIKQGGVGVGKSPLMPPFGTTLTDTQIRELVTYLRGFCK